MGGLGGFLFCLWEMVLKRWILRGNGVDLTS